jgi:alcohol dehydrogenase
MKEYFAKAGKILREWRGESYTFGEDVLDATGKHVAQFGKKAMVIVTLHGHPWNERPYNLIKVSLESNGITFETVNGARPNAPQEDVYRISLQVTKSKSDVIVVLGGGSTIDASKAAAVLNTYSPEEVAKILSDRDGDVDSIEPYFGVGNVTKMKEGTGRTIMPVVAVQTAASSAAHLTKYSNITDPITRQKKLIVDEAIIPPASVFDYKVTLDCPISLTLDGGLDGIAHSWEVFMSTSGPSYDKVKEVAELSIRLVVEGLRRIKKDRGIWREELPLDLGPI